MTHETHICPVCEEGNLEEIRFSDDFVYNGKVVRVDDLEGWKCELCGADPIFKDQIKRNHQRIVEAKRMSVGMLTGEEIKALRDRLDLTQQVAATLFGGGPNAFSKYERGDVIQSEPMDKLLWLVGRHPYLVVDLKFRAGTYVSGAEYTSSAPLASHEKRSTKRTFGHKDTIKEAEWKDDVAA